MGFNKKNTRLFKAKKSYSIVGKMIHDWINIMGYIVHSVFILHFDLNIGLKIRIRRQNIVTLCLFYAIHFELIIDKISITKQESDYDLGYICYKKILIMILNHLMKK